MSTPRRRSAKPYMPAWGWYVINGTLALILITFLTLSGIGERLVSFLGSAIPALGGIAVIAALYLLPTLLALGTPRIMAIAAANILLGWTGIGWIGSLIWALAEQGTAKPKPPPYP